MIAKRKVAQPRGGKVVIEAAHEAFKALSITGWEATQTEEEVFIKVAQKRVAVKTVSLSIKREKAGTKNQGWVGKLVRDLEPVITIGPLYEDAKTHCVNMELVIGGRMLSSPEDSLYAFRFKKEIKKIFGALVAAIPELNYRG